MTNAADWVAETRQMILGGINEERNKLSAAYTAGDDTLQFEYPMGGIQAGARICIGLNTFYVWSVTGQIATVTGGDEGTTDANASSGDVVRVRPRFTDNEIFSALNFDLHDLSSPQHGLFRIQTKSFTYDSTIEGYNMSSVASDVLSIVEIRYQTTDDTKLWPRIPSTQYRLVRDMPTTDFASGLALILYEPANSGYSVHVTFRRPFSTLTNLSTAKTDTGLLTTAYDLPPLGAAISLMAGREIKRALTESQGDTRRASEVPVGAANLSVDRLRGQRQNRIVAERARLDSQYPIIKDN
jgi:hypothetical protein